MGYEGKALGHVEESTLVRNAYSAINFPCDLGHILYPQWFSFSPPVKSWAISSWSPWF